MSANKFTPGPWKQSLPDDTAIYGADGWPVCETGVGQDYDEHFARMEADARLISAAPELLVALEQLVRPYGVADVGMTNAPAPLQMEFIEAVRKAKDALAKATGAQQ